MYLWFALLALCLAAAGCQHADPLIVYDRMARAVYSIDASNPTSPTLKLLYDDPANERDREDWLTIREDGLWIFVTQPGWIHILPSEPQALVMGLRRLDTGTWECVHWGEESLLGEGGHAESDPAKYAATVPTAPDPARPGGAAWLEVPDLDFIEFLWATHVEDWAEARRLTDEIGSRHPDSLLVRLSRVEAAMLERDAREVRALVEEFRADFEASSDPFVRGVPTLCESWLSWWERTQSGLNLAKGLCAATFRHNKGVQSVSWEQARSAFDSINPDSICAPLNITLLQLGYKGGYLFGARHLDSAAAVRADFLLFQGRPDEALAEVKGPALLGAVMMRESSDLLQEMVGVAYVGNVLDAFENIYLSGFREAEELRRAWPILDGICQSLKCGEFEGPLWVETEHLYTIKPNEPDLSNYTKAKATYEDAKTRWALLHTAAAARYVFMATGEFPPGCHVIWSTPPIRPRSRSVGGRNAVAHPPGVALQLGNLQRRPQPKGRSRRDVRSEDRAGRRRRHQAGCAVWTEVPVSETRAIARHPGRHTGSIPMWPAARSVLGLGRFVVLHQRHAAAGHLVRGSRPRSGRLASSPARRKRRPRSPGRSCREPAEGPELQRPSKQPRSTHVRSDQRSRERLESVLDCRAARGCRGGAVMRPLVLTDQISTRLESSLMYLWIALLAACLLPGVTWSAEPLIVFDRMAQSVYSIDASNPTSPTLELLYVRPGNERESPDWLTIRGDGLWVFAWKPAWVRQLGTDPDWVLIVLKRLPGETWQAVYYQDLSFDILDPPQEAKRDPAERAALLPASIEAGDFAGGVWFAVPDVGLVDVLKAVDERDYAGARELAHHLSAARPDSLFFRLCKLDGALLAGDGNSVRSLLAESRASFGASADPFVRGAPEYYDHWLAWWNHTQAGLNTGEGVIRETFRRQDGGPGPSWEQYRSALDSIKPGSIHAPLDAPLLLHGDEVPDFLTLQVHAKLMRIRADFLLMQGLPSAALEELSGPAKLAAVLMGDSSTLIGQLIGSAVATIACSGLEHVFLDGFSSAAESSAHWKTLDALQRQFAGMDWGKGEWSVVERLRTSQPDLVSRMKNPEASVRFRVTQSRWSLLHSGVAARYKLMTTREYPADASDFGPLLPGGADEDPFAPGTPLRIASDALAGWTIYSVGPDKADDRAEIEYDPTNGTLSRGDLPLAIPRERKYPFPKPGAMPQTRDGILALFAKGLPPDPFADTRGNSYIVSDTRPPVIWSVGPDTDQFIWQIPQPDYKGVTSPSPGQAASHALDGTYYLYNNTPAQPMYDPTNGVISAGNLYLIIQ